MLGSQMQLQTLYGVQIFLVAVALDLCVLMQTQILGRTFLQLKGVYLAGEKKENYAQVELDDFQEHIDVWFNNYVSLCGDAGCTNYTHLLAAGHILFYMERWGNLSNFSNQGWKSLNAMIKT